VRDPPVAAVEVGEAGAGFVDGLAVEFGLGQGADDLAHVDFELGAAVAVEVDGGVEADVVVEPGLAEGRAAFDGFLRAGAVAAAEDELGAVEVGLVFEDDVDDAEERVAAPEHAAGARGDLDALDAVERDLAVDAEGVADGLGDVDAVEEDQQGAGLAAGDGFVEPAVAFEAVAFEAGHGAEHVVEGSVAAGADLVGGDDGDDARGFLDVGLGSRGGEHGVAGVDFEFFEQRLAFALLAFAFAGFVFKVEGRQLVHLRGGRGGGEREQRQEDDTHGSRDANAVRFAAQHLASRWAGRVG
jgi:hypothetical protein